MNHLTYDHQGTRAPSTWRPAKVGEDDTTALVMCPSCGKRFSLTRQREMNLLNGHERNPTVSCQCPHIGCEFIGMVMLHCWPVEGFPIKSHS